MLLPYQGQAIWRAQFDGQELTMGSMFDEPQPVSQNKQWGYLDTCACVSSLQAVAQLLQSADAIACTADACAEAINYTTPKF